MCDEEDYIEYSDDDDTSWKVRRAAARIIEAIISTYSSMTADFYLSIAPILIKRFTGEFLCFCINKINVFLVFRLPFLYYILD